MIQLRRSFQKPLLGAKRYIETNQQTALVVKHSEFLSLVRPAQGDGKITLEEDAARKVLILRILNPTKRNAIDGAMMNNLAEIVDKISTSAFSSYIGLVICGDKTSFCSGLDLNLARDYVNTPERGIQMSLFMTDCLNRIRMAPLVSVAVISGPALGGGAEFTTCADFRIISNSAYVAFVHAKLGAAPGWGAVPRLVSLVGRARALDLLGTSRKLQSVQALEGKFADINFDENKHSCANIGIEFLQPFLQQQFPESVQSIKRSVAVASDCSSLEVSNEFATNEFARRWGSPNNARVIKEKLATKSE